MQGPGEGRMFVQTIYLAHARLDAVCVSWCFLVLVCVRTQCVPGVATRVVAKLYRPFF